MPGLRNLSSLYNVVIPGLLPWVHHEMSCTYFTKPFTMEFLPYMSYYLLMKETGRPEKFKDYYLEYAKLLKD